MQRLTHFKKQNNSKTKRGTGKYLCSGFLPAGLQVCIWSPIGQGGNKKCHLQDGGVGILEEESIYLFVWDQDIITIHVVFVYIAPQLNSCVSMF